MARVAGGMGLGRGRGCGPLIPLTTKNQGSPAEEREGGWGMVSFGEWELRRMRMGAEENKDGRFGINMERVADVK